MFWVRQLPDGPNGERRRQYVAWPLVPVAAALGAIVILLC